MSLLFCFASFSACSTENQTGFRPTIEEDITEKDSNLHRNWLVIGVFFINMKLFAYNINVVYRRIRNFFLL